MFVAEKRSPARRPQWHWQRSTLLFIAVLGTCMHGATVAQNAARELLNSERIAQEFGNYGIEVLASDAGTRVSNLFSTANGMRTCRTFAIVRYPASVDPAFAAEHAAIIDGGSIGAVFAARGWQVRKAHLYYGEVMATPKLAALMAIAPGTPLAEHVYVLDVLKEGRVLEYAALVEVHHPDYLAPADLPAIYGAADPGRREPLVAALLATVAERIAR